MPRMFYFVFVFLTLYRERKERNGTMEIFLVISVLKQGLLGKIVFSTKFLSIIIVVLITLKSFANLIYLYLKCIFQSIISLIFDYVLGAKIK